MTELADDSQQFDVYWLYTEYEWKYEKLIEEALKDNFPFRKVRMIELGGYRLE